MNAKVNGVFSQRTATREYPRDPLVGGRRGTRAGHTSLSAGFPPPGKKVPDSVDRMIGNARQHIAQVSLGIDAEHFAGLQDREHRGGTIAPSIGAQEDKIFPSMERFP
jgi:hypothetical protein